MKSTSWRDWNIGDTIRYHWKDFEGEGEYTGTVARTYSDHLIVAVEDMKLWVDDNTANMFSRVSRFSF